VILIYNFTPIFFTGLSFSLKVKKRKNWWHLWHIYFIQTIFW